MTANTTSSTESSDRDPAIRSSPQGRATRGGCQADSRQKVRSTGSVPLDTARSSSVDC